MIGPVCPFRSMADSLQEEEKLFHRSLHKTLHCSKRRRTLQGLYDVNQYKSLLKSVREDWPWCRSVLNNLSDRIQALPISSRKRLDPQRRQ